jgi:hypothetical protein
VPEPRWPDTSLIDLLAEGPLPGNGPHEWPEELQYHVAANWNHYAKYLDEMPEVPVAALPHDVVQSVFKVEFAIDEKYASSIRYLEWLATSMADNPLLNQHFDTDIRESLFGITVTVIQKYFMLLGDCIYDRQKKGWSRSPFSNQWRTLAPYLWWVGRTGSAMYGHHAGAARPKENFRYNNPEEQQELWTKALEPTPTGVDFLEQMEAVSQLLHCFDQGRQPISLEGLATMKNRMRMPPEPKKLLSHLVPYERDEGVFHWNNMVSGTPGYGEIYTSIISKHLDEAYEDGDGKVYFDFSDTMAISDEWLRIIKGCEEATDTLEIVDLKEHLQDRMEKLPDE